MQKNIPGSKDVRIRSGLPGTNTSPLPSLNPNIIKHENNEKSI